MEEILPMIESYVFVEHSNKPVITISGRPVVTGSHADFKTGVDIMKDINIHVDFHLPLADVEESSEVSEEATDNYTSDLKKARLNYKLSKATLIRKLLIIYSYRLRHLTVKKCLCKMFHIGLDIQIF